MKVYPIIRRFYKKGENFIFTEVVFMTDNFIKMIEFMDNEVEIKSSYIHIDTYVVLCELNQIYQDILREKVIQRKTFQSI